MMYISITVLYTDSAMNGSVVYVIFAGEDAAGIVGDSVDNETVGVRIINATFISLILLWELLLVCI